MPLGQIAANLLKKIRNCPRHARFVFSCSQKPRNYFSVVVAGRSNCSVLNGFRDYSRRGQHMDTFQWILLFGQAAIVLGMSASPALAEDSSVDLSSGNTSGSEIPYFRKIEDGSVVSNVHTSKWRVFTDTGRDFFLQRKLEEAETFFVAALQEAKDGFGERDPHVASACNNLAELYRVKKEFDKAEPLYLEAINILEDSFGPDDVRVGAALHNFGQFYIVCGKLEQARVCYERSLKIKRRVLGEGHPDYADTMYHLGTVLHLEGKEKDAEALILDSIRILEDAGLGESVTCLRKLQYLAQTYIKSNKIVEAEKIQRKILHVMELSQGWNTLDTVIVAERLALTLTSIGNLEEAEELLEKCLHSRKSLLPEDHIETAANMLHIARVKKFKANQLRKKNISQAMEELDRAKLLLSNSTRLFAFQLLFFSSIQKKLQLPCLIDEIKFQLGFVPHSVLLLKSVKLALHLFDFSANDRIARKVLVQFGAHGHKQQSRGVFKNMGKMEHSAMLILLQSLNALALLEKTKIELQESRDDDRTLLEAENILRECISTFKDFGGKASLSSSAEVKAEYHSCLKHLFSLLTDDKLAKKDALGELKDEIKRVEAELLASRRART